MKGNISKMVLKMRLKHIVPMNGHSPFSYPTFQRDLDVANCLLL